LIDSRLTNDRSEATLRRDFGLTAIHPAALALLNVKLTGGQFAIPTPQAAGRYFGSSISRFNEDQFNANLDYRFNDQNWLTVKFFLANAPFFLSLPSFRGTGANVPGFGTDQTGDVRVFSVQDVHSFSSRMFNEIRVGYSGQRNGISTAEPVNDAEVGINRSNADTFPGLALIRIANAAGGIALGTPTNVSPATGNVFTAADTFAMNSGKHSLRIGGEFRFIYGHFAGQQFTRGQIDFQDFRNFLAGTTMISTLGNGIGERDPRALDYNFFFQDDWKVSPRFTLNLGVRYELDLPVYDTRGRTATFDPALYRLELNNAGNPVTPPRAGFVQAGNVIPQYDLPNVPNVSKYVLYGIDANNLAPRVGFAYAPLASGRLVLRAGYGIFHSRPTSQYSSTSVPAPPGYVLGRGSARPLSDPFQKIPLPDEFPKFVDGVALSASVMDRGIRTPYFHQYNASLQFEIARQTIFEAAYVGTRGLNLFRLVAINQAQLASPQHPIVVGNQVITTNTPGNASQRAPFQGVEINSFFQNQTTAQSSYNSLQISLTRRLERGLQVLASYTYAKSIDNASGTGGGAGIVGIVNPGSVADTSMILGDQVNNRPNRGISDFDRTHRFVLTSLWDLPGFGNRASRVQRVLLRNWQISGIMVAMSGLPIDIVDTLAGSFYGLSGAGSPLARPNWAPGFSSKTAAINVNGYFFNPFAFFRPTVPAGQQIPSSQGTAKASETGTDIGNVGRNVLRGPHQVNVDFSVIKRFPIRESRNLELRAEFFNLFNHVNFANPISNLNAVIPSGGSINATTGQIIQPGDFGRIISTSNNPRLIQFVAKLNF